MAQNPTPVIRSSLEQDYEYDMDNGVFLFYPSRPAFESSRNSLFPPYHTGFYNLPVFRNDREHLPLPLRSTESIYSDDTAATYVDGESHDMGEDILRSMGYSRCFCLGLISIGAPNWSRPAGTQDYTPTLTQDRTSAPLSNFFTKLWNKFLRR